MARQERVEIAQHRRVFGIGRCFGLPPHLAAIAKVGQFVRELATLNERVNDGIDLCRRVGAIEVVARRHGMLLYIHHGGQYIVGQYVCPPPDVPLES